MCARRTAGRAAGPLPPTPSHCLTQPSDIRPLATRPNTPPPHAASLAHNQAVASCCTKADWPAQLPTKGALACTFEARAARRRVPPTDARQLASLVKQLRAPTTSERERMSVMEAATSAAYLTCAQAATVLAAVPLGTERVAAAAHLFTRASDAEQVLAQRGWFCWCLVLPCSAAQA